MKYSIDHALLILSPGSQWSITGNQYSGITWVSGTKPTEAEVGAKIIELDTAEPMRLLRIERDKRLAACDWRASSDLTISNAWKTYRQSLRDLPASASPSLDSNGDLDLTSVTWPTEPS